MLERRNSFKNALTKKVSEINERVYIKSKLKQQPSLTVSKCLIKFKALDGQIHEFETTHYYHDYDRVIRDNESIEYNNKIYPIASICWYEIIKLEETTKDLYFFVGDMRKPLKEEDIKRDEKLMSDCKVRAKELGLV